MSAARLPRALVAAALSVVLTAVGAGAATAAQHTGSSDAGVTFTVPDQVVVGEDLHLSGTGWVTTAGDTGSVIAIKLDEGAVTTTRSVTHPVTGAVQGNKTIWAMVQAQPDGTWSADVPLPTLGTANVAWAAGETHSLRLLTSTMIAGDKVRTESASFEVVAPATEPETPAVTEPGWAHETVQVGTAVAWVEQQVAAGGTSTIRLRGTGWTDTAGTAASIVAIKLNRGEGQQYTRPAGEVVQHPTASGDDTIWALLAADAGTTHVLPIAADGSFDVTLDAPAGLVAGQYLTLTMQSGRFLTGDVQRTVTSAPLVVGGTPWVDPGDGGEVTTCVPTSSTPTLTVVGDGSVGGTLHVTGAGWCHPTDGGSRLGIKIDEGAYSRLDTTVHTNKTIWATVDANPADGTIDAEIALPDGTTAGALGSTPAFTQGSHTLRVLTGSLKTGDTVRTLLSDSFVVGEYQPNGTPDPAEATEDLTAATAGGVTLTRTDAALTVTVPGAAADGSPRYLWSTWFRVTSAGTVVAPLAGVTLPVGTTKLAVQSGDLGRVGEILGWAYLVVAAPSVPATPAPATTETAATTAVTTTASRPVIGTTISTAISTKAPTTVPAPPAADGTGLTAENAGRVSGVQDGTVVTLTLAGAAPGTWVYLYAYSEPTAVGWVQVDANRQVKVDVGLLPAGEHKIAVLDAEGELVGWTGATVPEAVVVTTTAEDAAGAEEAEEQTVTAAPAEDAETVAAPVADASGLSATDGWLIGGGLVLLLVCVAGGLVLRRRKVAA
jgi:hypothetical protein